MHVHIMYMHVHTMLPSTYMNVHTMYMYVHACTYHTTRYIHACTYHTTLHIINSKLLPCVQLNLVSPDTSVSSVCVRIKHVYSGTLLIQTPQSPVYVSRLNMYTVEPC